MDALNIDPPYRERKKPLPRRRTTLCHEVGCPGASVCRRCHAIYMRAYRLRKPGWHRVEPLLHWRMANRLLAKWRRGQIDMGRCEHPGCSQTEHRTQPFFPDYERHPDSYRWLCPEHRQAAMRDAYPRHP